LGGCGSPRSFECWSRPAHHGDPFDRLLVAQALVERATLVTHDRAIEPYGAQVIWT